MDGDGAKFEFMIVYENDCIDISPAELRLVRAHLGELLQRVMCDISDEEEE